MPAVSTKQRKLMAIAEHNPSAVKPENKGVLKMDKGQLHDFASTKGLAPTKAKARVPIVSKKAKQKAEAQAMVHEQFFGPSAKPAAKKGKAK